MGKDEQEDLKVTIIKGAGGGSVGTKITLGGKTAIKLGNQNFYVTGRPQPGMRVPQAGSTTKLFIYKASNPNKVFRVDYHSLSSTGNRPIWHYNVTSGFAEVKGLTRGTRAATDHAVTLGSKLTGKTITIFRWGGRAMFLAGAAMSIYDVYHAENKAREISKQVGGWSSAIAMGKAGSKGGIKLGAAIAVTAGQFGPQVAAPEELVTVPIGSLIGGIVGGIGGGVMGWITGTNVTEVVFDWVFTPLQKEEWQVLPASVEIH